MIRISHVLPLLALFAYGCGAPPDESAVGDGNDEGVVTSELVIGPDGKVTKGTLPAAITPDTLPNGQASPSFINSCEGTSVRWAGNPIVFGSAQKCRRRNGTWSGPRAWSGTCFTDLANIDGFLGC